MRGSESNIPWTNPPSIKTVISQNSRVILGDAIDTINHFSSTYGISDGRVRESEQNALLARIKDDIQTVLRAAQ